MINYAPKSFAYLRQIEHINIDEMVESFLPKNNTQGLKNPKVKVVVFLFLPMTTNI